MCSLRDECGFGKKTGRKISWMIGKVNSTLGRKAGRGHNRTLSLRNIVHRGSTVRA